VLLADFSQQPLIGAPQCLSASCGALALALAANSRSLVVGCCCCLSGVACSHRQSACSQQPLIGCRLLLLPLWCCASLACSHRLAFSSFPIINNRSLVRLNVSLPHVVLLLLLAANSRSLVVGCCCCLSGVACSHRQSACNQQPLIGCRWLLLLCFSGLQPQACFLFFSIINNRSLVRASLSLCLMWCSCSCSQQPLIGCRLLLLPLWCCLQPQAVTSPLSLALPKVSTIKELWQVLKVHQSSFRLQDFKLGSNYSTKR
jgi:hypothetical protein